MIQCSYFVHVSFTIFVNLRLSSVFDIFLSCSFSRLHLIIFVFFFFNDTAPTEISTLSLPDALPIYAVGRHVLPLRAELRHLPIGPGLAAVRGEAPAVTDGAVPDGAPRPESERLDEVPGDRVGGGVHVVAAVLPGPRARPQDIDPLTVGPDPDGAVRRPREREHVHAEAGRVGQGRERLGGGGAEWSHGQQGEKCGVRNAECGGIAGDQPVAR